MNSWSINLNLQDVILDFMYLSSFLIIGTLLRRYVRFFQRFLIPNNLIGGFAALLIGSQGLGWIDLPSERLGVYVYHFLALTFIALGLRQEKTHWGKGPLSKGIASLTSYLIQGIIGLLVAFLLMYTIKPDLFIGIGLILPLGFGMGPGLAYTMGSSWEQWGFENGGLVGLTIAAIGYLYAFFVGMALINWGIRNGKSTLITNMDHITVDVRTGVYRSTDDQPIAGRLPLTTGAVESLSFHLGLIGFVYFLTYLFTKGLTSWLDQAGLHDFVATAWAFHFVFGMLIALILRKVLDLTGRSYVIDRGLMSRSMGTFLDFLVVGAVAAISLTVVVNYWEPILIMSLLAGPATMGMLYWICWRAFDDYHFERFIELFGEMTGSINSGLVLLRVTDPEFETPVAEDAIYGGGLALFLGIPLLITLNVPFAFYNNSVEGYWVTLGIMVGYWILLWIFWRGIGFLSFKKRA